jgi:hypothetical protein
MALGLPPVPFENWSRPRYNGAPGQMDNEELLGQVMPEGMVTEPETAVQVPVHAGVPMVTPTKLVVPLHPLLV